MEAPKNPYISDLQASRLKECLKESGLSQKQIAKKLNYTEQHISYVVNGKRKLTKELAIKLAEVLSAQRTSTIFASIPYSELAQDQKNEYSIDDIDENGNVAVPFDYHNKINYSYLLGESDIKNSEEVFDPPLAKNCNYMFQRGIQSILMKNGYALYFEGHEGLDPRIMENSIFNKNSAFNSIICSNMTKPNSKIKIVKTTTGDIFYLSALELYELLIDYEQLILTTTERFFKKLKVKHSLTIPPNDTPAEDIPL